MARNERLWDRIWRDKYGDVVIWQTPNIWLVGWAAIIFISLFFRTGTVTDVMSWVATAFLSVWAILEIFRGVNYFRRLLGLIVLVYIILTIIRGL
jgi:hypothetical protein